MTKAAFHEYYMQRRELVRGRCVCGRERERGRGDFLLIFPHRGRRFLRPGINLPFGPGFHYELRVRRLEVRKATVDNPHISFRAVELLSKHVCIRMGPAVMDLRGKHNQKVRSAEYLL